MDIAVIGGSYAGLIAALNLSRELGKRAKVRVVTDRPRFVQRIRLHQNAAKNTEVELDYEELLSSTGVELEIARVERIDLVGRRLELEGRSDTIAFDRLLIAVGSTSERSLDGAASHAFFLDDPRTASLLHQRLVELASSGGGPVVVAGGGLTAIEAASEIAESFPSLRVKLVSESDLAPGCSGALRRYIVRRLGDMGVEIQTGVRVLGVDATRVAHRGGGSRADAFVLATGFRAPELARKSGLSVHANGQARVERSLRSVSHPFVWAVGDAARPDESVGGPIVMACRTAAPMARHAAKQIAREHQGKDVLPMRFADSGRCVSLGRLDGVVGFHRANGEPSERVLTGRLAATVKEAICRFTVAQIHVDAWRARRATGSHGAVRGADRADALLPFGAER